MDVIPFSYLQIEQLIQELSPSLLGSTVEAVSCKVQKKLSLTLVPHSTVAQTRPTHLLLSFESPLQRFHLTPRPVSDENRSPLSKFLIGTTLSAIQTLNHDRILQLTFTAHSLTYYLIGEFFSKKPQYFLTDSQFKILQSLFPTSLTHYKLQPSEHLHPTASVPNPVSHDTLSRYFDEQEALADFEALKRELSQHYQTQLKKLDSQIAHTQQALTQSKEWEAIQHQGDLIKANLHLIKEGVSTLTVLDWISNETRTLTASPKKTLQETMFVFFKQAKKLRNGIAPLTRHLTDLETKLSILKQQIETLSGISRLDALKSFQKGHAASPRKEVVKKIQQKKALPYAEFLSTNQIKIWVGRNANANDELTFKHSNGNDWWLHANGVPGSHVVIKSPNPDALTLKEAMQLALYFSKNKNAGQGDVSITQCKYVKPTKQAGKVMISNYKVQWAKIDANWIKSATTRQS